MDKIRTVIRGKNLSYGCPDLLHDISIVRPVNSSCSLFYFRYGIVAYGTVFGDRRLADKFGMTL